MPRCCTPSNTRRVNGVRQSSPPQPCCPAHKPFDRGQIGGARTAPCECTAALGTLAMPRQSPPAARFVARHATSEFRRLRYHRKLRQAVPAANVDDVTRLQPRPRRLTHREAGGLEGLLLPPFPSVLLTHKQPLPTCPHGGRERPSRRAASLACRSTQHIARGQHFVQSLIRWWRKLASLGAHQRIRTDTASRCGVGS